MASHYDASALPTIWRMPDALWETCRALLPPEKLLGTPGRPVVPFRQVLDGILHVLRTGCQWKAVPREFGSGSTIHARFQEWTQQGVWTRLWAAELRRYDATHHIGWDWQSTDSATVPSPPRRRRDGARPHQSQQVGHQAACPERPSGRAVGRGHQRRQSHRHEAGRSNPGQSGGAAAPPYPRPPAASVSGQGLRLRRDPAGGRGARVRGPYAPQTGPRGAAPAAPARR
jgi:transposase